MIKAVIFDLDGVLVSTDELHYLAWKRLAEELGIAAFTRADNARQRGVSRMASLEVVLEKTDRVFSDAEKLTLAECKNGYYVNSLTSLTPASLLPGARETLERLRAEGIRIALGSASKNAPAILERTGLASLFDAIADGHDVNRSKPDPQVFLVAAQKLGLPPEDCMVAEDADAGVEAARAAGMTVLAVGDAAHNPRATHAAQNLADPGLDWNVMLEKL